MSTFSATSGQDNMAGGIFYVITSSSGVFPTDFSAVITPFNETPRSMAVTVNPDGTRRVSYMPTAYKTRYDISISGTGFTTLNRVFYSNGGVQLITSSQVATGSVTSAKIEAYLSDGAALTDITFTNVSANPSAGNATLVATADSTGITISGLSSTPRTYTIMIGGTYNAPTTSGIISSTMTASFNITTYLGGIIPVAGAVCFLGDAPVLTPRGYRPIREFRVGDVVTTADGREVAVKRVFQKQYGPSAMTNPYVIPKGMFGATRALPISPNHEVMVPGRGMVRARDLGLRRMKMADDFVYYNMELEDWVRDNLVVAGVTVESLAPATRITMTRAEFGKFVMARYGPAAAARLRSVCFEEGGRISLPAL